MIWEIGDRVKISKDYPRDDTLIGKVGTVTGRIYGEYIIEIDGLSESCLARGIYLQSLSGVDLLHDLGYTVHYIDKDYPNIEVYETDEPDKYKHTAIIFDWSDNSVEKINRKALYNDRIYAGSKLSELKAIVKIFEERGIKFND